VLSGLKMGAKSDVFGASRLWTCSHGTFRLYAQTSALGGLQLRVESTNPMALGATAPIGSGKPARTQAVAKLRDRVSAMDRFVGAGLAQGAVSRELFHRFLGIEGARRIASSMNQDATQAWLGQPVESVCVGDDSILLKWAFHPETGKLRCSTSLPHICLEATLNHDLLSCLALSVVHSNETDRLDSVERQGFDEIDRALAACVRELANNERLDLAVGHARTAYQWIVEARSLVLELSRYSTSQTDETKVSIRSA